VEPQVLAVSQGASPAIPPSRTTRNGPHMALLAAVVCIPLVAIGVGVYISSIKNASGVSDIRSLAVLPFKPLEENPQDDYLGLGMADALINKLTNIRQITVRPTSAIQKYCAVSVDPASAGKQLQVDALLEGRIQRLDKMIRVSV